MISSALHEHKICMIPMASHDSSTSLGKGVCQTYLRPKYITPAIVLVVQAVEHIFEWSKWRLLSGANASWWCGIPQLLTVTPGGATRAMGKQLESCTCPFLFLNGQHQQPRGNSLSLLLVNERQMANIALDTLHCK